MNANTPRIDALAAHTKIAAALAEADTATEQLSEALRRIREQIAAYALHCDEEEYTDIGDIWGLVHKVYRLAGGDPSELP